MEATKKARSKVNATARSIKELAVRNKRQRLATEALHIFARQEKVVIEIDAVAQPSLVSWTEKFGKTYHYLYTIVSKSGEYVFTFDMATGECNKLHTSGIAIEEMPVIKTLKGGGSGIIELGLKLGDNPDGSPNYMRTNFRFGRWFVLELLQNGHFFYVQREMTEKLRTAAADLGLVCNIHKREELSSRAKMATVDDKLCWSLPCQDPESGKNLFLIFDPQTGQDHVTEIAPKVWVLQQRVAMRRLEDYAVKHAKKIFWLPFFAHHDDDFDVWAINSDEGFICCRIDTGEILEAKFDKLSAMYYDKIGSYQPFDYEVNGIQFKAVPWLEAEIMNVHKD